MSIEFSDEFDFENRIVSPTEIMGENDGDNPLRPRTLDDYIGQEKVKENLIILYLPFCFKSDIIKLCNSDTWEWVLPGRSGKHPAGHRTLKNRN